MIPLDLESLAIWDNLWFRNEDDHQYLENYNNNQQIGMIHNDIIDLHYSNNYNGVGQFCTDNHYGYGVDIVNFRIKKFPLNMIFIL